ncbi:GPP34 family phosphoprotein, partial [Streptomyces goshikiensis]
GGRPPPPARGAAHGGAPPHRDGPPPGVGVGSARPENPRACPDDTTATVLAAVNDALMELEAVRQRRAIEDAAFDNIWRGN